MYFLVGYFYLPQLPEIGLIDQHVTQSKQVLNLIHFLKFYKAYAVLCGYLQSYVNQGL